MKFPQSFASLPAFIFAAGLTASAFVAAADVPLVVPADSTIPAGPEGDAAVSYTHLDVYKRQGMRIIDAVADHRNDFSCLLKLFNKSSFVCWKYVSFKVTNSNLLGYFFGRKCVVAREHIYFYSFTLKVSNGLR